MAALIFELLQVLHSKRGGLTSEEAQVFIQCRSNAIRSSTIAAAVGGGITWLATQNLRSSRCYKLSTGTATICGLWRLHQSLNTCPEHILSLHGSRMQKELANIMLQKKECRDNESTMQLISKYFYLEHVVDDSSMDQLKLRWRYRNIFGDHVTHSQRTRDNSYNDTTDSEGSDRENANETKHLSSRYVAIDPTKDPFDFMFGVPGGSEEIYHANSSSVSQRRRERAHRRSHRRHRMHHREVSPNFQFVQQ